MSLTEARAQYKPFQYPWAYDFWKRQQQIHWLPEEVPLGEDCRDWAQKISEHERQSARSEHGQSITHHRPGSAQASLRLRERLGPPGIKHNVKACREQHQGKGKRGNTPQA